MQPQLQAIQFIFDSQAPEEDRKTVQHEINQCVANGFVIMAAVPLDGKIYYQLVAQLAADDKGMVK